MWNFIRAELTSDLCDIDFIQNFEYNPFCYNCSNYCYKPCYLKYQNIQQMKILCIGEGPDFRDLRSVPKTGKGLYWGPFPYVKQSWDFSLFRNSDRLVGTFSWLEDPSTAWLVPSTAEDPHCWKQVSSGSKGAENTKEKSRQCFYALERNLNSILYMHI